MIVSCVYTRRERVEACKCMWVCKQWISEKVRDTISYSRESIETIVMSVSGHVFVYCVYTSQEMFPYYTLNMVCVCVSFVYEWNTTDAILFSYIF